MFWTRRFFPLIYIYGEEKFRPGVKKEFLFLSLVVVVRINKGCDFVLGAKKGLFKISNEFPPLYFMWNEYIYFLPRFYMCLCGGLLSVCCISSAWENCNVFYPAEKDD